MDLVKNQIDAIVGSENVIVDPKALEPYSKGNISFQPDRSPLMAVKPGNVEELKGVLKTASLSRIPVTPWSSAKNGHGASIPSIPGLTVDMTRFNRIHAIDEITRNAVIEPGVTFAQLQEAANAKGLRAMVPLELPADSSVLSTYLEMTPQYAWPRYGTDSTLTVEILLAGGDTVKTGQSAMPMLAKPYFPILNVPAFFEKVWFGAQGTFGIACKGAVKLKTNFETKEVLFIPFDSIVAALPVIDKIKRLNYPVEFFVPNHAYLAGMLAENADQYEDIKSKLPPFTAVMVLRGEPGETAYQKADLQDLSTAMGFTISESLEADKEAGDKILKELDFPEGYTRFEKLKGAYNVIPFICTATQIPMFSGVLAQMCAAFSYDLNNIGQMLLPAEVGRYHFQFSFYSDPGNPAEHGLTKTFFDTLSKQLIPMGAFFSRPYGEWASDVYGLCSAYKKIVKEFKAVVDPDNIMNPGKLNL